MDKKFDIIVVGGRAPARRWRRYWHARGYRSRW